MRLSSILFIAFIIIGTSCSVSDNDCSSFDDKFKTVDLYSELNTIEISESPELFINFESISRDTITYDTFAILLNPVKEYYSANQGDVLSFSIIPSAYACSPPVPVSEEVITGIDIYSDKPFAENFEADENLHSLFEVFAIYNDSGVQRMSLQEFLQSEPTVPDQLLLKLTKAPDSIREHRFTINYSQDGLEVNNVTLITQPIVLSK